MKHQVKFLIRQHTPLIHFQANEHGATIRPTEFKAKLDRWLIAGEDGMFLSNAKMIEKASEEPLQEYVKGKLELYKQSGKSPALDYEIRVEATTPVQRHNSDPFHPYFGNQGGGDKRMITSLPVTVICKSKHEKLLKQVEEVMHVFLLNTNFGARQGKGFGSYYVEKGSSSQSADIRAHFDYHFLLNTDSNNDMDVWRNLFFSINQFYQTLRSGINHGFYFKSLLWKYLSEELDVQWDKRTIKKHFFLDSTVCRQDNYQAQLERHDDTELESPLRWNDDLSEHLLWRDMLGLSLNQDWHSYDNAIIKKESADVSDPVQRFKSPLFFKPLRIGRARYFIGLKISSFLKANLNADDAGIYSQMLDHSFNITSSTRGAANLPLSTPKSFNYDHFLLSAFSTNIVEWVNDNRLPGKLISIYRQLNEQAIAKTEAQHE